MMRKDPQLVSVFDPLQGSVEGEPTVERRLSDLQGVFADPVAYEECLRLGDRLVYTIAGVEYPSMAGNLNYALGRILPGKVGSEYFMTRGHFHAWRPAGEIYIGLLGEGRMLLENEDGSQVQMLPLRPQHAVFVPGNTAHRTMNIGPEPLVYLGIYPSQAGHDYESIARQNFTHVIIDVDGQPTLLPRERHRPDSKR
jgi:glucose-6-phosphate isomerase